MGLLASSQEGGGAAAAATPGAPPAFATGPAAGPEVSAATFAEAGKVLQVTMTGEQQTQVASTWRQAMAGLAERRTGPKHVAVDASVAPYSQVIHGAPETLAGTAFIRSSAKLPRLPTSDAEIAFSPISLQSRWIEARQLSSERLTRLYLERIARLDPIVRSVITATPELALSQARQADAEIAAGRYRGSLHGILGVVRICSTQPASRRRTALTFISSAFRPKTRWSSRVCMPQAR